MTEAKAQELNALLWEQCHGDAFQAGLVPIKAKAGAAPTHRWASWPENQHSLLKRAQESGKVNTSQITARKDSTTATFQDLMTFEYDENLDVEQVLEKLGLKRSDIPYVAPAVDAQVEVESEVVKR